MTELCSYLMIFIELLSFLIVADAYFIKRFECRRIYIGVIILLSIGIMGLQRWMVFENVYAKTGIALLIFEAAAWILYKGNLLWELLLVCMYYIYLYALDYGVMICMMFITGESIQSLMMHKSVWALGFVMSKSLLMITCVILAKKLKSRRQDYRIPIKYWLQMIIILVGMILNLCLIIFYAINENRLSIWIIVDVIVLVAGNILFLFLERRLEKEREIEAVNKELERQIKSGKEKADFLLNNYQEQRRLTHEFHNHLFTLEGLYINKNYEALGEYLHKLLQSDLQLEQILHTNHPIVDVILNRAYLEARNKDIAMEFELSDLQDIPLANEELVIVLSNLLDNAIEASSKLTEGRRIIVRLTYDCPELVISIRNTVCSEETRRSNIIETTKKEKWLHGYGLQNVKRILEKKGSEYALELNEGWFQFTAVIR